MRSLCIIIDQETRNLSVDYKNFRCNGYNKWFETFSVFNWTNSSNDPSYTDLNSETK